MLPSLAQDFFEVTLALVESASGLIWVPLAGEDIASKSLEVKLAWEDSCPRAPDQAKDSSSPIVSSLRNKYFETSHCFGLSITPPRSLSKSDR